MHTHTCTYHTHTCTYHTHTHAHITHTHAHIYAHTHMHISHTHMHIYICTHTHAHIYAHTHVRTHLADGQSLQFLPEPSHGVQVNKDHVWRDNRQQQVRAEGREEAINVSLSPILPFPPIPLFTYAHTCMHPRTHIHTSSYIYTPTYTHTHTHIPWICSLIFPCLARLMERSTSTNLRS